MAKLIATIAVTLWLAAGAASAGDPVPGVDVKLGKNPGGLSGKIEDPGLVVMQATGDESAATLTVEQTVNYDITDESTEQVGVMSVASERIEFLTNTVLSGTITGNWTGDSGSEGDAAHKPGEVAISTGDINGAFSAPGVTNVLQNTGVMSLQQGAVVMPVSIPAPN